MEPTERKPRYRAYLLRCWETQSNQREPGGEWRFSLEDPHTSQRRNFAGLDLLIAALRSDLLVDAGPDELRPRKPG